MIYNVDFFINKFSAIPESNWTRYQLWDEEGRHCVNGHCGVVSIHEEDKYGRQPGSFGHSEESFALTGLFQTYLKTDPHRINDHQKSPYQQSTPKARILAALQDIKKIQQPQIKEQEVKETAPKIIHVYHSVQVEKSIKTNDLILS